MRICYDYQTFVLQKFGGISKYFTKIGAEIEALGDQVKFIAPLHRNNYIKYLPTNLVEGRYMNDYPKKTTKFFMMYNRCSSISRIREFDPHIIHETYYASNKSSSLNRPVVLTVFDMIHELYPKNFSYFDLTILNKKKAINRADKIICISHNTKKDLLNLFDIAEKKISVIHLGFECFNDQGVKIKNESPFNTPYLLYVGNRGGYKNFYNFIEAFSRSKRLRNDLNIVAFGGEQFSKKELFELSKYGFSENQISYVNGDDALLSNYYQHAAAFIYPSIYEGFGIPPLEAMARGCPVISSQTSSMPEIIGNAAQYFDPVDIDSIIFSIESVIYSSDRIHALRTLGYEQLKLYSWAKCSADTQSIYKSLL
jgi:glycosyltransferase involved in cell wall biosynthesis